MSLIPTAEQAAILDFGRSSQQSLLINALAGAAKTSTLVMLAHALPPQPILCLAFNKKIAEEMAKRMPGHVQCLTLNSAGHRAWSRVIGKKLVLDTSKTYSLIKEEIDALKGQDKAEAREAFGSLLRGVGLAKSNGFVPTSHANLATSLITESDLLDILSASTDDEASPLFLSIITRALEKSIKIGYAGGVDFDDQIYLSSLFGRTFPRFPTVLVDEAQDLSPLNHLMIETMKPGRLIAVGDPFQSIYAFRGADRWSMGKLKETFGMEERTLSVSFRCPIRAVERARFRVPRFAYRDNAPAGEILTLDKWSPHDIPESAAILCRNNAPLFSVAIRFIKAGRGVSIVGRDIGPGLVKLLKKFGDAAQAQDRVLVAIRNWEIEALARAKEDKRPLITDKADCLRVFAEAGSTLGEAIAYAEHLFASEGTIRLMTGHKAKGLEFDDVVFLDPWRIPCKYAKIAALNGDHGPMDQELNLKYVIETRWKQRMYLVDSEKLV